MNEKDSIEEEEVIEKGNEKPWLREMMKEFTLTGLATVFMTEDSIRGYLKDKKLPKEMASLLLDNLTKKKDDFYGLLVKEFSKVLSKIDLKQEMVRFLEAHQVNLKISFEKKKESEGKES